MIAGAGQRQAQLSVALPFDIAGQFRIEDHITASAASAAYRRCGMDTQQGTVAHCTDIRQIAVRPEMHATAQPQMPPLELRRRAVGACNRAARGCLPVCLLDLRTALLICSLRLEAQSLPLLVWIDAARRQHLLEGFGRRSPSRPERLADHRFTEPASLGKLRV
ncbi:hypothetical protein CG717_07475 [Streptomyces sp. CB02613]|nr:hypothetical protein CG717_07475 [Streptomyces sp. CB02613]